VAGFGLMYFVWVDKKNMSESKGLQTEIFFQKKKLIIIIPINTASCALWCCWLLPPTLEGSGSLQGLRGKDRQGFSGTILPPRRHRKHNSRTGRSIFYAVVK
jgi:hypothetical protein